MLVSDCSSIHVSRVQSDSTPSVPGDRCQYVDCLLFPHLIGPDETNVTACTRLHGAVAAANGNYASLQPLVDTSKTSWLNSVLCMPIHSRAGELSGSSKVGEGVGVKTLYHFPNVIGGSFSQISKFLVDYNNKVVVPGSSLYQPFNVVTFYEKYATKLPCNVCRNLRRWFVRCPSESAINAAFLKPSTPGAPSGSL